MNYQGILYNILTSTVVVGIATHLIQKKIDKRFNRIEEFQKTLMTIRKERYDTLLKTLMEILEKIIETEYYIRYKLPEQYNIAQQAQQTYLKFDYIPLQDAYIFIEKRCVLLNESLSKHTSDFFKKYLIDTYNGFIDKLREVLKGNISLDEVNNFIPNRLGEQYAQDLNALRKKIEEQARQILYDNNKSGV